MRATTMSPEVPRSSRWTIPGRSGSDPASRPDRIELGVAGQQAVHQGAGSVAGAGVDDQPGRLVHHQKVGIFVHHVEVHPGVAYRRGRGVLIVPVDLELLAHPESGTAAPDDGPVDADPAPLDQRVDRRARQVGHQGYRLVHPYPVE